MSKKSVTYCEIMIQFLDKPNNGEHMIIKTKHPAYKTIRDAFKKAYSAPRVSEISYNPETEIYSATCHSGWKYYGYAKHDNKTLHTSQIFINEKIDNESHAVKTLSNLLNGRG